MDFEEGEIVVGRRYTEVGASLVENSALDEHSRAPALDLFHRYLGTYSPPHQ